MLSEWKKISSSVYFSTSKISLYNLTSLSLWFPHASRLSQCPKGCGQQQPQESTAQCGKVEVSSALPGPDQPYLKQNSQGQAVFSCSCLGICLIWVQKHAFFKKRHFFSLHFCHSLFCPKCCNGWHLLDPVCVPALVCIPCRGKWDRRGLGKKIGKGTEG